MSALFYTWYIFYKTKKSMACILQLFIKLMNLATRNWQELVVFLFNIIKCTRFQRTELFNSQRLLPINTGGTLRWPKKSSKEMLTRKGICMKSWDGPKFESFSFSLISARNINHVSKSWDGPLFWSENPEMAQNSDHLCLEIHFSSNSGPTQD